ncbi:MFS transporter [Halocalculus aciditolerans]|uniref:MFS transporter n=1 Tax=Halocalculus aciditolerans TaxID=1383812 RepID=UPI0016676E6E|nr:MFS transporter [Halocalculus aciditolerans]
MIRRDSTPPALVVKYYLYEATATYGFFWPVFTLFLLSRDLTFAQIGLLGSLSAAASVLGEIPTGYVADRLGRRVALALGSALLSVSLVGHVVARGFPAFAALWVLWGAGRAFRSGSADAWLYDALEDRLDAADAFTRIRGRGSSVNQTVSAVSMLTAGALYAVDDRLPLVLGAVVAAAAIPVVWTFPTPETRAADAESAAGFAETLRVVRATLTAPALRRVVLYAAVVFAAVGAVDTFIQPVTTTTLGFPEAALGPLYAAFSVASAVAGYAAPRIERALSPRRALAVLPAFVAAALALPVVAPLAALPAFVAAKAGRAAVDPILGGHLNDHASAVGRATLLSAASLLYALVRVPAKPAAGALADATTPLCAVAAVGACLLFAAGLFAVSDASTGTRPQNESA